ncbi:E3 ubiquitin-protein ligase RMA1H1-like [Senna tora]|uniref:E3 ubiquitin-protein ligase RMA n=1 Tax=Senna tora TaxID=362788 RepID=A0A834WN62_9FABA|nr:E3 ubiquitin-protein ligase RMA1H1-like [Senna tora]
MALDQYLQESLRRIDSFEDKSYLGKWNSTTEDQAIADSDSNASSSSFDCNICLECVQDPVVTLCGHLYCWPCIYKWLHFHAISPETEDHESPRCPVCKSQVSQSSLVPLYGRGQTAGPSKGMSQHVGHVIPRRPLGPAWPNHSGRSSSPTGQGGSQFPTNQHMNAFDTTIGVFGEMVYARVFGNQLTNMYTYPNSYNVAGNSNPRIRRHLMQADKSLSRICFFLLCCVVLCLLLF